MSGRRIDDHSSWMGSAGKDMIMPMGAKTKTESSATGAGKLGQYEETTEQIKASQEASISKIHGHGRKPHHRN